MSEISTTEASKQALQLLTLLVYHYPGILSQEMSDEILTFISENIGPVLRAYLARAQEVI